MNINIDSLFTNFINKLYYLEFLKENILVV